MPKSWIDRNSDTAELPDAVAAAGAQHQAPRFAVPQDDEDIVHGLGARLATPRPCVPCCYGSPVEAQGEMQSSPRSCSRMGTEIAAVQYPRPFCANCRAPEKELGPASPCYPCYPCRVPEDMDMTPLETSLVPACFVPPCRISSEPEIVAMPDNRIPPGWGFGRVSDDSDLPVHAAGTEIETATDVEITLLGDSIPTPCGYPCRMSDEAAASQFPLGCGFSRIGAEVETSADVEMTLLGGSFPPPCIMPCRMSALDEQVAMPPCGAPCRMSEPVPLHGSAAQLPPPAYYCRQSQ